MPTKPALALILAAATLLSVSQAQAHAKLVSATPAENATVAAPQVITLKFTEKLQSKFSGFGLTRNGAAVPVKVSVGEDQLSLVGAPARPLSSGAYEVNWHAVTSDTHRMQGAYSFTVR